MERALTPTPAQIRAARELVGLTQTEAATLIYSKLRTWQDWESGKAAMHAGLWELFCIKTEGEVTNPRPPGSRPLSTRPSH